ncbi:hypothetical protein N7449_004394, partial [Penicillium cf. viridicatum]
SIPDERSDWPTLAIHELIDSPKLGTEANPIVIGDDPAPLGSASNPIVIHIDKDCGYNKAEQLSSDEKLIDKSFPAPADERTDVNSVSILSPTTQLACEDPEEPRILKQNCPRLDDKATKDRAPKVIEDHSVALYGRTSQAETDQHKYKDNNYPICSFNAYEPSHGSYGRWLAKRKLSDTNDVSPKPRRSERLIKRARQSVTRM